MAMQGIANWLGSAWPLALGLTIGAGVALIVGYAIVWVLSHSD